MYLEKFLFFTAVDGEFGVYTNWIETEFSGVVAPYGGELGEADEQAPNKTVVVEVNGQLEVLEVNPRRNVRLSPIRRFERKFQSVEYYR